MFSRGRTRSLAISIPALCIAVAMQMPILWSQSLAPGSSPRIATVFGRQAVAGEVLVQFDSVTAADASPRALDHSVEAEQNVPVGRRGLRRIRSRGLDVESLLTFFRTQRNVVFAEPNYIVRSTATPDDPRFSELWGLLNFGQPVAGDTGTPGADISAPSAWSVTTGTRSHVIGVIDSGVDYTHPDLAANIWSAPSPFTVTIGGVVIHCPASSHGFNAISKTCDPMDTFSHGTHVAGTIGAVGNNGVGVAGVNWNANVIAAKFLEGGVGTTADAIDSIDFMIQVKAIFAASDGADIRVLNNSWGGGDFSTALRDAIAATGDSEMLFVAAAGNGSRDTDLAPHYPASYDLPNVISVAATDNRDRLWSQSNFGAASVDLAAPGEFVLSTIPGGYAHRSGTSMATPHVAGAAALVLSTCAYDTVALKNALLSSVDPVPALTGRVSTGGRLNLDRAVRSCLADTIPPEPAALVATPGDAQVSLWWHASGDASGYDVKRSLTSGGPYVPIATDVSTTGYVDSGLVNGTTYFYVVSAVNALGEGADSPEASATPRLAPPPPPAEIEAIPGDARVDLAWTSSPGADAYHVKRSLMRSGPFASVAEVGGTAFTDLTVVNGTKYFYVVSAFNAAGEGKNSHKVSTVVAPVPAAPSDVTATEGASAGEIQLSWTAVEWATVYRVRRSTTSGGPYSGVRKGPAPSFTDTGLKSGRRYYYLVTALNGTGESPGVEVSAVAK